MRLVVASAVVLFVGSVGMRADVTRCQELSRHGRSEEANACYRGLTRSGDALEQAEGFRALQEYQEANTAFQEADRRRPNSALVKTEWAHLYREHAQPGDAAKLYEEAMEADAKYAPAYLGLASIVSESYDKKALELAQKALALDPKLFQAHELMAYLALEDDRRKDAVAEANQALASNAEALDGMAVLSAIDWLNGDANSQWLNRILKVDPRHGEAYETGAHFLIINYRYEEGIALYRKALELNPRLWRARSQLGVNLMRLGYADEARQQLQQCYDAHFRDPETVNSLRLLDRRGDYERRDSAKAEVLLDKKEAALLYPYVKPEVERAMATYERKYKTTLPGKLKLEIYPNHDDFVVRTIGLPGQGGLLGVTFGSVVAMDSPSARPPGQVVWADTLWHELSHVYAIQVSKGLVPRWFTEGLAVHEEGTVSPGWGNRLTPDVLAALKEKKLLPVEQLDRGFVRPEYPNQVLVSYYQAGRICDYMTERFGDAAVLSFLHAYAERKTTVEALASVLHQSPAEFDNGFQKWLEEKTGNQVAHFDDWRKEMTAAQQDWRNKNTSAALEKSLRVVNEYPDYVSGGSAYQVIADCYLATGKKQQAAEQLEAYRDRGGSDVELLKKLAQLDVELSRVRQAETTLKTAITVYPEDADAHRSLGDLLLKNADAPGAIREYKAVLTLKPDDVATSHFDLARALVAGHQESEAKEEILAALETAPDFKPAQKLLLQLSH